MDDDRQQAYANQASTIDIGTITSGANVEVLQRIRGNDPYLTKLALCGEVDRELATDDGYACYCPSTDEDLGWAGVFVGNNTNLHQLTLYGSSLAEPHNSRLKFFHGVSRNRSIWVIRLRGIDLSNGDILQKLKPFFENNTKLRKVSVAGCALGGEGDQLLSSMLRSCKSIQAFFLGNTLDEDEQPTSIIAALSSQTKLDSLYLTGMNVGSNECRTLAALPIFSNLRELNLMGNNIDDDGVEVLAGALRNGNKLKYLGLTSNPLITTRGLQSIAGMLEHPSNNLEKLKLLWNGVDDEGANILAQALANNRKLRELCLVVTVDTPGARPNLITVRGWQAFADVLCNTSSVEATHRSNHTLKRFSQRKNNSLPRILDEDGGGALLSSLAFSLESNRRGPREEAACRKIIKHHLSSDEGMGHFARMNRAVLPRALAWVPQDEPSLLYRVVRNLHSEMIGFVPTSMEAPAGRRSKRQKTSGH